MDIREMISHRKGVFQEVEGSSPVADVLGIMSGRRVSSVVVMDPKGYPAGIFTERDLVRCHMIFPGKPLADIRVDQVMTEDVIVAEPSDNVQEAMAMMIKAGIRHLPVVRDNKVVDLLGLEDLVHSHVGALNQELHYLKDYITDLQDAAHD